MTDSQMYSCADILEVVMFSFNEKTFPLQLKKLLYANREYLAFCQKRATYEITKPEVSLENYIASLTPLEQRLNTIMDKINEISSELFYDLLCSL